VLVPLVEIEPELIIPQRGRADAFLAAVADQRIEKMKSPCQCIAPNAADAIRTEEARQDTPKGGCP